MAINSLRRFCCSYAKSCLLVCRCALLSKCESCCCFCGLSTLPEQAHSYACRKLVKDQVALDELPKDLRNVADRFSRGEISSKQVY